MTDVACYTVRSRDHIEHEVVAGRRLIGRSIGWLVVMLSLCMWMLNEHLLNRAIHCWRMHQIHQSASLTITTLVFGASSCSPPLLDRLVRSTNEKVLLFSAHFEAKQCRDSLHQPHSFDLSPGLCSVAFRSCMFVVCFWVWNLTVEKFPDKMFPLFLQAGGSEAGA